MPPKKTQSSKTDGVTKPSSASQKTANSTDKKTPRSTVKHAGSKAQSPNKRDAPSSTTVDAQAPSKRQKKGPRQGARTSARHRTQATASPRQVLSFLLSSKSLPYCFPKDDLETAGTTYSKTSPSEFSPFEHLLTASILSKPLSHRLGMRTIRTLFNEPFSLHSADEIVKAGEHRVWEAMEAARTQHRQKTASYIYQIGEMVKRGDGEGRWFEGLKDAEEEGALKDKVKKEVKGVGETGANVFRRRVQSNDGWEGFFPFADRKAAEALEELGVDVPSAQELWEMVRSEVRWDEVGDMGFDGHISKLPTATRQKIGFVVILERALGAILEGKRDELLEQI